MTTRSKPPSRASLAIAWAACPTTVVHSKRTPAALAASRASLCSPSNTAFWRSFSSDSSSITSGSLGSRSSTETAHISASEAPCNRAKAARRELQEPSEPSNPTRIFLNIRAHLLQQRFRWYDGRLRLEEGLRNQSRHHRAQDHRCHQHSVLPPVNNSVVEPKQSRDRT